MNRRKPNISRWYVLGLAAILVAACAVLATGTAWARYRWEDDFESGFQSRLPATVHLGVIDGETGAFDPEAISPWVTTEQGLELSLAVANGTGKTEFAEADQKFSIRLISTLGLDSEKAAICLTDPAAEMEGANPGYIAQATPIALDSPLYHSFGDGWVYRFMDERGQELSWTLEGGALSCTELRLTLTPGVQTTIDPSLLQIQVLGNRLDR